MITEEKWDMFETIRRSGVTNMFDVNTVVSISERMHDEPLTKRDVTDLILGGYDEGKELWHKESF